MRDIYGRYAIRELQEELLEGMVSRHKEMPQISFSEEDVATILSYLYDLARKKQWSTAAAGYCQASTSAFGIGIAWPRSVDTKTGAHRSTVDGVRAK